MSTLLKVTKLATEAGLAFLVIGGNAVIAHGYQRGTKDLDLLVRDSDTNDWDVLVRGIGYNEIYRNAGIMMYEHATGELVPLDLVTVADSTFERMASTQVVVTLNAASIQIPRLSHLVAMKLHAIRQNPFERYERDLGDIVALMTRNGVSLETPEFRATFNRHATAEIRAEVERRLAGPGAAEPWPGRAG